MAGHHDAKWLKEQLSRVLGWDELIITGLVDAVVQAAGPGGDRSELEAMVENFMADSPAGIALINDFIARQQQPASSETRAGGGGGGGGGGSTTTTTTSSTSKSYAALTSAPSASAAARTTVQQQQQQQQQHGRGQRQQQQQQSVSSKPAGPSAAPYSWQALGGHQNKGG
ncbi:hypothetical protein VaNZ11_002227, partial [Volvox africanus]